MNGVQVVVLQVHCVHLIDRHHIHFAPIEQLDPVGPGQGCIEAAILVMPTNCFTVQVDRLPLGQIPDHESTQALDLLRRQRLNPAGIALGVVRELEVLDHIPRIKILQRIGSH